MQNVSCLVMQKSGIQVEVFYNLQSLFIFFQNQLSSSDSFHLNLIEMHFDLFRSHSSILFDFFDVSWFYSIKSEAHFIEPFLHFAFLTTRNTGKL